jgi:hypothetical protein
MKIKYISFLLIFTLAFSYAFASFGSPVSAENTNRTYSYMVEITFGPFAFYYDYGIWDVNELDYVKSETSQAPAKGTVDGYPGWYGFDGNTNRVSVTYQNTNGADIETSIDVSVVFTLSKHEGAQITGVTMTGYADSNFNSQLAYNGGALGAYSSGYSFNVPNSYDPQNHEGVATNTYFSFDGIPTKSGKNLKTTSGTILLGTIMISIDRHNPAPTS